MAEKAAEGNDPHGAALVYATLALVEKQEQANKMSMMIYAVQCAQLTPAQAEVMIEALRNNGIEV